METLKKLIIPSSVILGTSHLISRLLGVIRDRLLANEFGATREIATQLSELDTYYAAFRIPDLLFNLLILGVIASVFLPIFTDLLKKDTNRAWELVNVTINVFTIIMLTLSLFAFVFAPNLIKYFTFGFTQEGLELTTNLTRIMLVSPIIFGISAVVSSILNTFKLFVSYALAPIFYNLGIIFGIVILVPSFGVYGVAIGVIIGAFLHLFIQLPALYRTGFHYNPIINFKHPDLIRLAKLAFPRVIALAAAQINLVIATTIASTLIAGSITIFNWAQNIQSLPVGIIGLSVAVSSFPVFAELATNSNTHEFTRKLSQTIRAILFLIIPATAGFLLLRTEIVRLVLGSGKFNWTDTVLTANTLGFLSISLFAQALIPLLARAYYAKQNTIIPVTISLLSMAINIIGSLIFTIVFEYGVMGLAIAFTVASIINMSLLLLFLPIKLKTRFNIEEIILSVIKITLATLIMAAIVQVSKNILGGVADPLDTFGKVAFKAFGASTVGIVIYFILAKFFKCQEVKEILANWKHKND